MWDSLELLLADTLFQLSENPNSDVINNFINQLGPIYDSAKSEGRLAEFKQACQKHPIAKIMLEDPYVHRAFVKPRGYAGDAVMLDYIYRTGPIEASPMGAIIHEATTRHSNAQSILWRRDYLARQIAATIEGRRDSRILSVASGHMRELEFSAMATSHRDFEFWALDQDKDSIEKCVQLYPELNIKAISKSIAFLFRRGGGITGTLFDLIYSAGLSDYLSDKTLEVLIRILHEHISPNGLLIVGNFTYDSRGRGFMEGFMDWSLIYRDEADLIRIVENAAPMASYKTFCDEPGNVAYIEIKRA